MNKTKRLNLIGILLLLSATVVWGSSFFILKETISELPTFYVLAIRFLVAGICLFLVFFKKIKKMTKRTLIHGLILGLWLVSAYLTQTIGLENTTPGRNAFLSSLYCIMCPFIIWGLFKVRPRIHNVVSAILCVAGILLVSLSQINGQTYFFGDAMTIVGAFFFGLQIIFSDKYQKEGSDTVQMLVMEILATGVFFAILSLVLEVPSQPITNFALNLDQALKLLYLTLMCTLYAQAVQIVGLKFVSANQGAIVLSLESVFGVLFSVVFADEKLTLPIVLGFVIIFVSLLMSELGGDIFAKLKKGKTKEVAKDNLLQQNGEKK